MVQGQTFAIIGFVIWPDLPKSQLLEYTIKIVLQYTGVIHTHTQHYINHIKMLECELALIDLHLFVPWPCSLVI